MHHSPLVHYETNKRKRQEPISEERKGCNIFYKNITNLFKLLYYLYIIKYYIKRNHNLPSQIAPQAAITFTSYQKHLNNVPERP